MIEFIELVLLVVIDVLSFTVKGDHSNFRPNANLLAYVKFMVFLKRLAEESNRVVFTKIIKHVDHWQWMIEFLNISKITNFVIGH
jgi:hypothetical protein